MPERPCSRWNFQQCRCRSNRPPTLPFAGLLWIAGERSTPASWESTPLADLFPFRPPLALEARVGASIVRPTGVAERLGVVEREPALYRELATELERHDRTLDAPEEGAAGSAPPAKRCARACMAWRRVLNA
mgnify:CR=1 FL=1